MSSHDKLVRLRFEGLSQAQEQAIRQFINQALVTRVAHVQGSKTSNIRKDVRARFRNLKITVTTEPTKLLDGQEFTAILDDLSTGGASIIVRSEISLAKNGRGTIRFKFLQPPLDIVFVILGLKEVKNE